MPVTSITSLFPITDPTWIFFVVLCIILFAPILLNRFRIPHIIGMLLAGVVVGPYGLDLLQRDSSFQIFGNVGLLYIMFLAGVEIDLGDFNKNKNKSIAFGLFTFSFPFSMGCLACHYILGMEWASAILMASMFSSHTLVSYAIASRFGVTRNLAVNMAVGGTIITDTLSLLVLAVISRLERGESNLQFWCMMVLGMSVFISSVLFFFPRITRFFFRRFNDQVLQFIFVLALLLLAAIGAHVAGLEGILGAFLAGLVLNRLIPSGSPLMGRLEFVGNALFIPYFLIGVGMLIDVSVFFKGPRALFVAGVMTIVATFGKYMAAWLAQKIFGMKPAERTMLFGLSSAHAAATLAVVMVGYELQLFDESVFNGTFILILITCIISSFAVENSSRNLVLSDDAPLSHAFDKDDEKILIPMVDIHNVENLVQVALLMRNPKLNRGLIGLNVVYDNRSHKEIEEGRKCLHHAEKIAVSANVLMQTQSRLATNLSNGIIHALRENDASELILGLHRRKSPDDSFFGGVTLGLLGGMSRQIILVRCTMPVNTLRRIHVVVPAKAEFEAGFYRWVDRLARMSGVLGCRILFYANQKTITILEHYISRFYSNLRVEYEQTNGHNDLKLLTEVVNPDHLLVVVCARRDAISYHPSFEQIPDVLDRFYSNVSRMIIFPDQFADDGQSPKLFDPRQTITSQGYEPNKGWWERLINIVKKQK